MKSPRHSEGAACLPVTGLRVTFQQPTGRDDLLLREVYLPPLTMAHAIAERLVRTSIGEPLQAAGLPVADFDALLLALRQFVFGDVIRAEVVCSVPGMCRANRHLLPHLRLSCVAGHTYAAGNRRGRAQVGMDWQVSSVASVCLPEQTLYRSRSSLLLIPRWCAFALVRPTSRRRCASASKKPWKPCAPSLSR